MTSDNTPQLDPGMSLLIANRGEIARRVIRSAAAMNIRTVAIYAEPDRNAPFVDEATTAESVGGSALADSYLSVHNILDAADRAGASHVHPGYGFLSENAEFARAVIDAGLVWVGPRPEAIDAMGSKINARRLANDAGVPVIPGYNESQDEPALRSAAAEIGYPILVKASAGGGGKGIRIAHSPDDFDSALADARQESARAFGDDSVIVERYITKPRHIEVQIAADRHGNVIDFGTRECSVQRRYQKVLEEAPAPNLDEETRRSIRSAAVQLAEAIGYDSVGTVEFIVDAETEDFFFLEMNTRIQVEHTVTEEVFGVDLIELQIRVACGARLPELTDGREPQGHSIEARINAEDAWNDHLPQTGTVEDIHVPEYDHVRWDSAVVAGSVISPHYDSMIGKLIVWGADRIEAVERMDAALAELRIEGVTTNVDFHRWLIAQPEVRLGRVTTRFLDQAPLPTSSPFDTDPPTTPWGSRTGARLTPHRGEFSFDSPSRDGSWHHGVDSHGSAREVRAPFPGVVTELRVSVGDEVQPGQSLLTIEAMKMLHPVEASGVGVVGTIEVEVGDQVATGDQLITFETPANPGEEQ